MASEPAFSSVFSSGFFPELSGYTNEQEIRMRLQEAVAQLLHQPGDRLSQILYRLDVSETAVHRVFQHEDPFEWPAHLASLIWEREKQRQFWRTRYAEKEGSAGEDVQPNERPL